MRESDLRQNNELQQNSKKIQSMLEVIKNSLNLYSDQDDNELMNQMHGKE